MFSSSFSLCERKFNELFQWHSLNYTVDISIDAPFYSMREKLHLYLKFWLVFGFLNLRLNLENVYFSVVLLFNLSNISYSDISYKLLGLQPFPQQSYHFKDNLKLFSQNGLVNCFN